MQATELRAAGVAEARSGNLQEAIELFTQALAVKPPRGSHLILSNRSAAHRSLGNNEEAARDADQAVACAPEGFSTGYIRQACIRHVNVEGMPDGMDSAFCDALATCQQLHWSCLPLG